MSPDDDHWPALPFEAWTETREALHLWTQVVGKVRVALTPWINHAWQSALYVTARGLSTGPIPHGRDSLDLEFDFIAQRLHLRVSTGAACEIELKSGSVADFFQSVEESLAALGAPVRIHGRPNEIADALPFAEDHRVRAYDPAAAERFWRVLLQVDRVLKSFRTGFLGKVSPVHFFWGSFDMAVTRFSGRAAPPHPGGVPGLPDAVAREAYSHEVSSSGFWPGGSGVDYPAFYSYAYPAPPGFAEAPVRPAEAEFNRTLGEFILPYDAVRTAADPDAVLTAFLQSTYEAAADAAGWGRAVLECAPGQPGKPRPV